jgi:hypothetical protein
MRQLIGALPTPDPYITEEVWLSDEGYPITCIRQHTVDPGEEYIEVIAYETEGEFKKERRRARYCRKHGSDYERKARGGTD